MRKSDKADKRQLAVEFYFVGDHRSAGSLSLTGGLSSTKQFDPDPAESARCRDARIAAVSKHPKPPHWPAAYSNAHSSNVHILLQGDPDFVNKRDEWPTKVAFKARRPNALSHVFLAVDYGRVEPTSPREYIASQQWREAIEKLEPNRHIFLPVALEFLDGTVNGYSWIFNKQTVGPSERFPDRPQVIDPDRSDLLSQHGTPTYLTVEPKFVAARRKILCGLHWAKYADGQYTFPYFASADLASAHRALLLPRERRGFSYLPVTLVDG